MPLPRVRHEYLLRELELHGRLRSVEVAERIGVSEITVRRDIMALDRAGKLARVHGGATALRSQRGPRSARVLVGVVVPSTSSHLAQLVRGLELVSAKEGVRLVLGVSHDRTEVEEAQVARMLRLGVAGIAIAPTDHGRSTQQLAAWARDIPVPVVLMERRDDETARLGDLDLARSDLTHGAVAAMEHLASLGHQRIALGVHDRTPTAPSVREGYRQAMSRIGLGLAPTASLPQGHDDPAQLYRVLGRLLDECAESGTRAALVHTDYHAARLVEVALDRGLRVPDDLAVVAYDDENAELAAVPLTAVTPPRWELGREVLRLLADRIGEDGESEPHPPRHVTLQPRLTVRDSCGAPPR